MVSNSREKLANIEVNVFKFVTEQDFLSVCWIFMIATHYITHVFHYDRIATQLRRNYEKKIVVTRSYDTKIVTIRKYVTVFRNSRFQLKCKSSATASFYFASLTTVVEQSS